LSQILFYDRIKPTSVMIFITAKKNNTVTFSNNNCTILRIISSVLSGSAPSQYWGLRSYSDTPQWVGILWTTDKPKQETATSQHTTFTRDRQPCPRRCSNRYSQLVWSLRRRGRWHR